jgi:hypothetical protein
LTRISVGELFNVLTLCVGGQGVCTSDASPAPSPTRLSKKWSGNPRGRERERGGERERGRERESAEAPSAGALPCLPPSNSPQGWTKSTIFDFRFPGWQRRICLCQTRNGSGSRPGFGPASPSRTRPWRKLSGNAESQHLTLIEREKKGEREREREREERKKERERESERERTRYKAERQR